MCGIAGFVLPEQKAEPADLSGGHQPIANEDLSFLGKNGLSSLHVTYEDLIARPDKTIEALNAHLNTKLTVDNLRAVYRGPLYKVPRNSPFEYAKAAMIYLKNYPERAST